MKKIMLLSAIALTALSLTACSATKPNDTKANDKVITNSDTNESKANWDEASKTFTSEKVIIKIDKIDIDKDYDNRSFVKIYYTLTNKQSNTEQASFLIQDSMKVQQESKNTSNDLSPLSITPDENGNIEETHLDDNIKPEGTISGYYPLLLENNSDPINILFQNNDTSIVATYKVQIN